MFTYECAECGDPLDVHTQRRFCSHECMTAAREEWERVHDDLGIDAPPFPQIGHYSDAPGVGEWTPMEMQRRIDELRQVADPNA